MRRFHLLFVSCLSCLGAQAFGQGHPLRAVPADPVARDSAGVEDPAPSQSAGDLLPESLGPMETLFWSRHGLVRSCFGRPLNAANREEEMRWRRALLSAHQIVGFATFASMLATVYYGQRMYDSQDFTLRHTHRELAFFTIGAYTTTALFALATPPPLVRRKQWSSVSTHKALAWVHATGLIVTPSIGLMIKDSASPRRLERFHLASAYLTTAAFGASILVLTF